MITLTETLREVLKDLKPKIIIATVKGNLIVLNIVCNKFKGKTTDERIEMVRSKLTSLNNYSICYKLEDK